MGSETTHPDPLTATLDPLTAARPEPLDSAIGRKQRDEIRARLFDVPSEPEQIGRYRVLRRLGQGAIGSVYACKDDALDREVAVKVLRSSGTDAARLRREAQALARLSDPHVVAVYEVGEHAGRVFVAMELIDGVTLRQWQCERSMSDVLAAYAQAGRGLAAAHRAGIVHRDFKPDNVMIARDGRVRVLDFGLAAARTDAPDDTASLDDTPLSDLDLTLTSTGLTLGTPAYMALEQLRSADVDARADQFSFAVALFEALHGHRPFRGGSAPELADAIRGRRFVPGGAVDLPRGVDAALRRALAAEAADRFVDMDALLAALDRANRPRRGPVLAFGASIVALVGVVALTRTDEDACARASAPLDAVWGVAIADELRAGLRQRGALNDRAGARIDEIDTRAEQWRTEALDVCGSDAGDLAIRRACLDDTLAAITSAAELLRSTQVDQAPSVLSLATCAALRRNGAIPSRAAPADLAATMEVRAAIDLAIREGASGEYDRAAATIEPAVARARTIDDPALLAEGLLISAATHGVRGDFLTAERESTEAYELARAAGHDRLALRAATDLVDVVGSDQRRRDDGEQWARAGEALAERLPPDDPGRARLMLNRGLMRLEAGDHEAARADLEGALRRFEAAFGETCTEKLPVLSNLAHLAVIDGDPDRAYALLDEAVRIHEQLDGVDHPELIAPLVNRALVSTALRRWADAHRDLDRAAAIVHARGLVAEMPSIERNMAELAYEQGLFDTARGHIDRALAGFRAAHGAVHPRVLWAQIEAARLALELGELDHARVILHDVVTAAEAEHGTEDALVGNAALVLAEVELRGGDLEATWRALQRATAANEGEGGTCNGVMWLALAAEVLIAHGAPDRPIAQLEQLRVSADVCSLGSAELDLALAHAHAAAGHPEAVYRPLAIAARDRWRARGHGWSARADAVDAWLEASRSPHPTRTPKR